ncbi:MULTISPECIES: FAD:protein FMN transferase [Microbacterium]|uniref:FAD:protein FMN transferase n=1 Tax=Microbacterium TaxID=33882 RepID=UPI00146B6497|nr:MULTISPECIES: FAD:protein FMN transferase [Microbacterium]
MSAVTASSRGGASWRFDAIGTRWEIATGAPLGEADRARVVEVIDRFDAEWSRFRADSVVTRLGLRGGAVPAPPDAAAMLEVYARLSDATGGAVNPLVGASLERLGYDAAYSLTGGEALAAPADWETRLTCRSGVLALNGSAVIDVGAIGKGRLVDLVAAALTETAAEVVVDAGGDLAVRGAPQRIGLEHPFDPRRAIGVWEVTDASLCASAVNRRAWGDGLHHVLDARTGAPVRTIAATWAVAPEAMRADAIATALFFEGGPRLAFESGVEWVRMTTDGRVEWSPGCRAELFTQAASVES